MIILKRVLFSGIVTIVLFLVPGVVVAESSSDSIAADAVVSSPTESASAEVENDEGRNMFVRILMYLPNRVFDIFDIFRLRARVGPGFGVGVRATELLSANIGSYMTAFVGLHGPRQKPTLPWPLGLEMYSGAAVSVVSVETENYGPHYSPTEIGFQAQLLIIGLDFGFDPWEIVDFLGGFVGWDPRDDDL